MFINYGSFESSPTRTREIKAIKNELLIVPTINNRLLIQLMGWRKQNSMYVFCLESTNIVKFIFAELDHRMFLEWDLKRVKNSILVITNFWIFLTVFFVVKLWQLTALNLNLIFWSWKRFRFKANDFFMRVRSINAT